MRILKNSRGPMLRLFLILLWITTVMCSKDNEGEDNPVISVFKADLPAKIMGLSFDSKGNLYVATYEDTPKKRILKITHDGTVSTLLSFECLAFEYLKTGPNDSLYASVITDPGQGCGKLFRVTGDLDMSLISEGFTQPVGITFDPDDNIFVVDAMEKKVYKISPDAEKSVYLDLGADPNVPDNFYHCIEFDNEYKNLYVAGLNSGGRGNVLKYEVNASGATGEPQIVSSHYCKFLVIHHSVVFATIDDKALLIVNEDGSERVVNHMLLNEAGYLCFGQQEFGENTLYINTFDKIVQVESADF